jgi:hypothetical protein
MNSKQKQQHVRSIVAAILLLLSIHDGAQAFAPGRQTHLVTTRGVTSDPSSNRFFVSRLRDKSNGIEPYTDNEAVSLQSKVQMEVHDLVSRATGRTKKSTDPTPSLVLAAQNIVGHLKDVKKNQAAFAAMSALAVALTMTPLPSEAAMSGGRMGGSYSSPRSSSRPSYTSWHWICCRLWSRSVLSSQLRHPILFSLFSVSTALLLTWLRGRCLPRPWHPPFYNICWSCAGY